ncbi:MAG: NAD(P)-binding domain-containing protein [Kofleriaceae bacterium]
MSWVVPLGLAGLAITVMAVFTTLAARRRHVATAQAPATLVGPSVLLHDINDDRCTGCDACVAVCPTNVLELVDNKSRVLRFEDCIQCEACMFACPTEALVMFPEGQTPPPLRLPEMDEFFQTRAPGQYLIGEVAGKPLVKNAANLGRMVVEHMLRGGLRPSRGGISATTGAASVDVAIVGSGPAGLSAALTCVQRGLSYVVLEKEQLIASTIARYPKGKLVMAEPYDTENLSLLPVFDSSKEQLLPIWTELLSRLGVKVSLGESVESVVPEGDGFAVKTTVAKYRAQRVVLAIGTRGKPRTLGVPGENLPKVSSLLDDPDDWRGQPVLVVGGGDSAVEAALALADAGAKVIISYRGNAFARAAPKNKQAIEAYAAEGRLKTKLQSTVVSISEDAVILQFADGSQKQYANAAAFVLIGADPPVAWLEKLGVSFIEREHQYQLGRSDELVRAMVASAMPCPEDAARAAAQVLGGAVDVGPALAPPPAGAPKRTEVSVARKWLRAATNMLAGSGRRGDSNPGIPARRASTQGPAVAPPRGRAPSRAEGVRRASTQAGVPRDQLSSSERTRILRMLRDEGGRRADEDSQVFIGPAPSREPPRPGTLGIAFDDDSPVPELRAQRAMASAAQEAKPAVVVGLEEARGRRPGAPPPPGGARRPVPPPFRNEETRQVDADMLARLRSPAAAPTGTAAPLAPIDGFPPGFPAAEGGEGADTVANAFDDGEATQMTDPRNLPRPGEPAAKRDPAASSLSDIEWDLD